jgi:hypothetical protein
MTNLYEKIKDFISHLNQVFPDTRILGIIENESDDQLLDRAKQLNNSLNTANFANLIKNRIKIFSHKDPITLKISQSFFGPELSLKKIFNNQEETIKLVFWQDLKDILLAYNQTVIISDPENKKALTRISDLTSDHKSEFDPKEGINKILNTDKLNASTNDLINDIFGSFESSLSESNGNPFSNILQISQTITDKYKDKIENGEVNLDDLLKNMTNLPGMENMGGMVDMLSKQMTSTPKEPVEKVIIDENFSTADVQQGEIKDESSSMNMSSMLKTIDSIGSMTGSPLLSGLDGSENGEGPDMSKIMGLFNKLGNINDPTEINNVFETELGIDINKFTDEMSKVLEK